MAGKRFFLMAVTILAMAFAPWANVSAQVIYGQPGSGATQFIYTSWTTEFAGEKTTLSQYLTPFTAFVPVRDNFDFTLFMANSGNSYETPLGDFDMNAFSDIRLEARHSFANDRLVAALGLNLPTGKREITLGEEWLVSQELSTNHYELPMRRFGDGFGFTLVLGGATMAGERLKLGAGVSYQYVGEYQPYAGFTDSLGDHAASDYNPGDILSINGRGEIENGDTKWSLDLVYGLYVTDKVGDTETFRQGPQLDTRLGMNAKGDGFSYGGMMRYVWRGNNKVPVPDDADVVDSLLADLASVKLYGNEFSVSGYLSWTLSGGWWIAPNADVRVIGNNDFEVDGSTVWGFGASAGKSLTEHVAVNGGVKYYTGAVTLVDTGILFTDVNADVTGYQLTLGLTATL